MQRRFNSLQTGDYPYLVAQSGGAIAGYAYAAPYRARFGTTGPTFKGRPSNSVQPRSTAGQTVT